MYSQVPPHFDYDRSRPSMSRSPDYAQTYRRQHERSKFTMTMSRMPPAFTGNFTFTVGDGTFGQLGQGQQYLSALCPLWLKLKDHEILDVAAGAFFSALLTDRGEVLTFGHNEHGSLGRILEDPDAAFVPIAVALPGKATMVTVGDYHAVALMENGNVFAWGTFRDSHGMMGLTTAGIQMTPLLIWDKKNILKICSGTNHVVLLTTEGDLYTMGCGEYGQLGRVPEVQSSRYHANAWEGLLNLHAITLPNNQKCDEVWAGGNGTFIRAAGTLEIYVCGGNNHNQLGANVYPHIFFPILSTEFSFHIWRDLKCDEEHTIAIDIRGRVYVIGYQEGGRLGLGPNVNESPVLSQLLGLAEGFVSEIGVGYSTSFAAPNDIGLIAWGSGSSGQLGNGDYLDRFVPCPVSSTTLMSKQVLKVSGGARHTIILARSQNLPYDI